MFQCLIAYLRVINFVELTSVYIFSDHVYHLMNAYLCTQTLQEAIAINNSVPQGLSSSIFTKRPEAIFRWIGLVQLFSFVEHDIIQS